MEETENLDRKSIRVVSGSRADFLALAQDCVAFANGSGGQLLIGIEDDAGEPPADQCVDDGLLEHIRKRIGELTVNVQVLTDRRAANNGGQYIVVTVPRATGVASTSDGRYFLRVGDTCIPVVGDAVLRLANERPQVPWELMTTHRVERSSADAAKLSKLISQLKASDRVKPSVKEKSPQELLDHYHLAIGDHLTNLGVLLLGASPDRARLGCAPVVQAIRYDDRGVKIDKLVWDDHHLSPIELLDAVWSDVPDFRERYELPRGLFRESVPAFEPEVVRELLVNALVHRPYTQRGDIFLNLHPDRLEVVNPGRLPLGVTPVNILHASRRRNDALARIFHDLRLMEREGSGFDMMYEKLLQSGRQVPITREGPDSVRVTVPRRVLHPGIIQLLGEADQRFHLSQRERISLGLLATTESATATDLAQSLGLDEPSELRYWMGRLLDLGLVRQTGRTRATRYFVPPRLLRATGLDLKTTLQRVEPHRLRALILEDLDRYPGSSSTEIHKRIGSEIPFRTFRRALIQLAEEGLVNAKGERRWRRYSTAASNGQKGSEGQ